MGMDLSGVSPISSKGEYFRNNCWWWRPLWNFIHSLDILTEDEYESGHYNDGQRIGKVKSKLISKRLTELLDNGEVKKYEEGYNEYLNSLPLEDCEYCEGDGIRTWEDGDKDCNVCNTEWTRKDGVPIGKKKPFETSYPFDEENVREFRDFVKDSGGFEIY
tara:strand:+ start:887 stop:1369 length:483 start_codon:yes stop_codon:yes gene_type:complete